MDWHDAIAGGIPSDPGPGSPQLRNDISDELADHLACAMQRELRRNEDEFAAEQAVIERFGDPRAIARELWWSAVKERVMNNRILLAIAALAIIACIAATVFAFTALQRERLAREAAMAQMMAAQMAEKEAVKAQLDAQQRVREAYYERAYLSVAVVLDAPGNPPVPNVSVSICGNLFNQNENTLTLKTDESGKVEFGPVKPGVVNVSVRTDDLKTLSPTQIVLYPATHRSARFVQPVLDRRTGQLRLSLKWPGDTPPEEGIIRMKLDDDPIETSIPNAEKWCTLGGTELWMDLHGRIMHLERVDGLGGSVFEESKPRSETYELPIGKYTILTLSGCLLLPDDSGKLRMKYGGEPYFGTKFEIKSDEETHVVLEDLADVANTLRITRANADHPLGMRSAPKTTPAEPGRN